MMIMDTPYAVVVTTIKVAVTEVSSSQEVKMANQNCNLQLMTSRPSAGVA